MNSDFYPQLSRGDSVEVAPHPDAPDSQWMLADVAVLKNDSCDVRLASGHFRHDVIHVDDPRCKTTKIWAESGRGVFRLSQAEVNRRKFYSRIPAIEAKLARLEQQFDRLAMGSNPKPRPKPRGRPRVTA